MAKHSKMQKVVIGTLAVMMVASLVLVVAVFTPVVALASGGQDDIGTEEICSNSSCWPEGGYCQYQGQHGFWETCCYTPFPQMCQYCPSPCCWRQCHWW